MAKKLTDGSLEVQIYNASIEFIEELGEHLKDNFYVDMTTSSSIPITAISVKNSAQEGSSDYYKVMVRIEKGKISFFENNPGKQYEIFLLKKIPELKNHLEKE